MYGKVGKGKEEIKHKHINKGTHIVMQYKDETEKIIREKSNLPEQYIVKQYLHELKDLEEKAVYSSKQYRDKLEQKKIDLDKQKL